jgi:hypothetical protein
MFMNLIPGRYLLVFALIPIIIFGCKDDAIVEPAPRLYKQFFPLYTGYWIEYDADSVVHLDTDDIYQLDTAIVSYDFRIREVVDTPFVDANGDSAFTLLRYRRDNDTLPWTFMHVWTAKVTNSSAQKVEDNVRFIKMSFPIEERGSWNGNAYNYLQAEDYSYEELFDDRTYNSLYFDSTARVLQSDFISSINMIMKEEIYGRNAGMIYRQFDSLMILTTPTGIIKLNGTEYKLTVTDYKR